VITFVFPGEGAVPPGAGRPWRDHPSWAVLDRLSAGVGVDVGAVLLDADAHALRDVAAAQLAAVGLGTVVADALRRAGVAPGMCVGHGVGEYTALAAAGAFTLDDLAAVVAVRASALADVAAATPGRSSAIDGLGHDDVGALCALAGGGVWVSQHNGHRKVTVAGTPDAVSALEGWARGSDTRAIVPLPVDAALHSPLVEPATARLGPALDRLRWRPGTLPVIATLLARPYPARFEPRRMLSAHVVHPVRWRQSVAAAVRAGASAFVELAGPPHAGPADASLTFPRPTVRVETPADLHLLDLLDLVACPGGPGAAPRPTETPGEVLSVAERLVVSPRAGQFLPASAVLGGDVAVAEIRTGEPVGRVGDAEVRSSFSGRLMGLLARPGERVTPGQPLVWIRTTT
jgi:[acyl-carrier-protein] S-malonyltransferase